MAGLDSFVSGGMLETLRSAAQDHPVVMLVAVDTKSYAIMMSHSSQESADVMELSVTVEQTAQLRSPMQSASPRRRASTENGWWDAWSEPVGDDGLSEDSGDMLRPRKGRSLASALCELWNAIVKPVLAHMGIQVSGSLEWKCCFWLTLVSESGGERTSTASLVPDWALCIASPPRSGHIHRPCTRVLLGLRDCVVHSNDDRFAARTE
jgi:hypothetical protein